MRGIDTQELQRHLGASEEVALLDVREQADFGEGHLLAAACFPSSSLELDTAQRLPRRGVRIVLCDAGDGLPVRRAGKILGELGYTDVLHLEGGVRAWADAGGEVFRGFNVVSKAFGEWVEHHLGTPSMDAEDLHQLLHSTNPPILLDSRPADEHLRVRVPGATHCPGVELLMRAPGLVSDARTPIVVHCAGRTRSIIGAQMLRNAGIRNPVYALRNGTMGWQLAGLTTASGGRAELPAADRASLARLQETAEGLRLRCGVARMNLHELAQWRGDGSHTLYCFDVRTAAEYEAGHLPGFRHAPGGQLLQQFDEYAPVRHARIVIADDDGLRANGAAVMLWQMGVDDLAVVRIDTGMELETGPWQPPRWQAPPPVRNISPQAVASALADDAAILIDLSPSSQYRSAHVEGAWFGLRSELPDLLQKLPPERQIVLTSSDGEAAAWAASEAGPIPTLAVMDGGNRGWAAAGRALVQSSSIWASEPRDAYVLPYDYQGDVAVQMQAYIDWELALVAQLRRDGGVKFRLPQGAMPAY